MGKKQFTTTKGERVSYGMYAFGAILSYYVIMSFLQLFMTNLGIPAAMVGMIFVFAKVWDAINDPVFGVMVDKVNLKGGKYRPWLRIAGLTIPLTTILLFIIPSGASIQVKVIWSAVAYILWDTAYTMYDVPMNAIVTAMTENQEERNKLYSLNSFCVYLGGILVAVLVPMLYPAIGWPLTILILGGLCLLTMMMLPGKAKERYGGNAEKEVSIREIFMSLVHNKYLLIFTLVSIVSALTDFSNTLLAYVAIHCLGSESYITLLTLASALPVLAVALLIPKMISRVEKFKLNIVTRVIAMVLTAIMYFVGYDNVILLLVLFAGKSLFSGICAVTAIMFVADCVEYGQFCNGERNQGIAFATKAFTNKIVVALTGALGMFGVAAVGFVEGEGVVQGVSTIKGLWALFGIAPLVGGILALVIMLMSYRLRDQDVALMIRCNNGEISREEAYAAFQNKF
ncbi:glycoside-pentoside-hexuronide (GPH):cation symporter [Acetatifactor muris]|uniref:Putative symporter YjmB n=1 Tax=Acetatifactor muris TaxID=879566 RepID=A0A2K4ZQH1_9FIRM|nr:glycoside-pentoside-hexuronide (GPH):cation symporter [Acetatifactor muris]MCI8801389.1 MFS transporter [Lachnospiraceae bacterium]MCR2051130.1 glycoside-pentoside-hexuronide (GPH):cation symporter [Acetatifactor muris]SOY32741.1 putative symporter YjmB [Acetatifactor muris]